MEQLQFSQDIEGRIANLNWKPASQWAIPMLEAVSNSLHAVSNLTNRDQMIKITLIREGDDQLELVTDKQKERPIVGFRVEDNGVGFNEENFKAFKIIDTQHKRNFGGKGVGRLFWLKAFSNVIIRSVYSNGTKLMERNISFSQNGIKHESREVSGRDVWTSVEVRGVKPQYKQYYKRLATTVSKEIVEEFLPYFILNGWPGLFTVTLTGVGESEVEVERTTNYSYEKENFDIDGQTFCIVHVKNFQPDSHRVHFCAADRVVSGYKSDATRSLPKRALVDNNDNSFSYMGLITSEYLTNNVSTERDAFLIPEKVSDVAMLDVAANIASETIDDRVKSIVSGYLQKELERAQKETVESIAIVLDSNPELKFVPYSVEDVKDLVSSGENEIKRKFRERLYECLEKSRDEIDALISRVEKEPTIDFNSFRSEFDDEVKRFSLLNQSHVVSYILYRKHVIKLFEKALCTFKGDRVAKEDFIHNLIFPMRAQGAPTDFDSNHNLWLIDDKLTMVEWIASDVPISKHEVLLDGDTNKEPDIVFYNLAYANEANMISSCGYSEVHIVEFKRPFTLNNDPIKQIDDYIYDIKHSRILHLMKDKDGYHETAKKMHVSSDAMFYGYVIFDLKEIETTEKWDRLVHHHRLTPFMNGYTYQGDNILVFVNSFENVLAIAKKRNEVFFDKLSSLSQENT